MTILTTDELIHACWASAIYVAIREYRSRYYSQDRDFTRYTEVLR